MANPRDQHVARLRTALDAFESSALLGEIAGLFTCPENAAFGLRLGVMAELAAVPVAHGGTVPSRHELRRLRTAPRSRRWRSGRIPPSIR